MGDNDPDYGQDDETLDELIIPDFECYGVEHALTQVVLCEGGLTLVFDDHSSHRVPHLWLREFSPDAGTFHTQTREQRIALTDLPEDLTVSDARVAPDGFLEIQWHPEGLNSRYHPGWLYTSLCRSNDPLEALPARNLWPQPAPLPHWQDGAAVYAGDVEALRVWLETLHRDGVSLLGGLPADPAVIPGVAELIGPIRPSNFGDVFEVQSLPSSNSNAYTAIALGVHSDLATREYVPGLQFLFCLQNSATGGESLLVDGFAVAEQLRNECPEFFEVLATLAIPFGTKDRQFDHRFCAPVLEHDGSGQLSTVRHTYWLRSPMHADFDTLTTFYAAYRRFQTLCNDPDNQMRFRLSPGQLMAFDNRRVLHGRDSFDAESGARLLRGCYGEREELESRLRILYRAERARRQQSA